jgi:uncharacterized membrane protein
VTLVSLFSVAHVHSSWHCCCWAGAIEGIAISPTASTTFFSIVASLRDIVLAFQFDENVSPLHVTCRLPRKLACDHGRRPNQEHAMATLAVLLSLHILSAVVWVGGMFAAYMCLRPAVGALEPPQRLRLWRAFFQKFFPWVWAAVLLLLGSGYWMLIMTFGGFAGAPLYINLMQALAWAMIALFVWLFHGPWLAFKRAVDAQDWPAAAVRINRIRQIIMINLPLGLIVIAIGSTGRFWG